MFAAEAVEPKVVARSDLVRSGVGAALGRHGIALQRARADGSVIDRGGSLGGDAGIRMLGRPADEPPIRVALDALNVAWREPIA